MSGCARSPPKENLVGFAAITINDCFVVEGLKVCASEKGLYVNMPSQQDGNGNWRDICKPITADFRKQLNEAVAEGYGAAIEKSAGHFGSSQGDE